MMRWNCKGNGGCSWLSRRRKILARDTICSVIVVIILFATRLIVFPLKYLGFLEASEWSKVSDGNLASLAMRSSPADEIGHDAQLLLHSSTRFPPKHLRFMILITLPGNSPSNPSRVCSMSTPFPILLTQMPDAFCRATCSAPMSLP